ncbi:hypothetical protein [Metabacillus sp. Hm71]|uniref:hypothetical protein n=1 Tax=Metabacillus sp. Hm71 TaxID=3450743 RepID=UPI003F436753
MKLVIDDKYFIASDKLNYTLYRIDDVRDKETKEITGQKEEVVGHYGLNLALALKRYTTERIRDEDKLNIEELVKVLKGLEQHVEKIVKKENITFVHKKEEKE